MQDILKHAMAWSLILVMIAAAGCGSGGDTAADAEANGENSETPGPSETTPGADSADARSEAGPPVPTAKPKPQVLIETTLGSITVELEPDSAWNTVSNFLSYVDKGHYDNTIFHEVIKDYVVIGGTFSPDLREVPAGVAIRNEARDGLNNERGTIAMARQPDQRDSATCQFFFNLADNSSKLDHKESADGQTSDQDFGYCAFGRVVSGMTVVDAIGNARVHARGDFDTIPEEDVIIRSMRRLP